VDLRPGPSIPRRDPLPARVRHVRALECSLAFFFHRYGPLFAKVAGLIGANALSFGLAHLVYGNWVAVALTTLGGALFAYRYARSESLLVVSIEHGLWGDWLFTIGAGWYLYSGAIR